MPLITMKEVLSYAPNQTLAGDSLRKSYNESIESYDVFLSHSFKDARVIYGLKKLLEKRLGFSTFVDWMDPRLSDRSKVTTQTADIIREIMGKCINLFYCTSQNTKASIWMKWELGYFDGKKGKNIYILPIEKDVEVNSFDGQEFLGLYPYLFEDDNGKIVYNESKKYNLGVYNTTYNNTYLNLN